MVLNNSGAARAYGCLSTSFSRLERDTRRREAFSLYWDSNAFALSTAALCFKCVNPADAPAPEAAAEKIRFKGMA